jgi:hypothetical protein
MALRAWPLLVVIGLCGCWKPPLLRMTPREATDDEIKYAISQLPEGFRAALQNTNPENAGRLDLRVWAFDYEGGPFNLIVETIGAESDRINFNNPRLRCEGEKGRVLIWLQPRESSRMAPELREKFRTNQPPVPNLALGIDTNDQRTVRLDSFGNPDKPVVPWWFGWNDADVSESTTPVSLKIGEVRSILRIEATEKGVPNPRKVILSFQAAK